MDEIYTELKNVIEYLNAPNVSLADSCYNSVKEAINDINSIIVELKDYNNNAVDRLSFLFSPTGDMQKIALNNGWIPQFNEISKKVDIFVGMVRGMQKNDAQIFDNMHDGKYTDSNTYASCPGRLNLAKEKWNDIEKIYNLGFIKRIKLNSQRGRIQEYIRFGDTQPAIVISIRPLLITAFSDEMDAVVMLKFPDEYANKYRLKKYDRLITVNTYSYNKIYHDIFIGKNYLNRYGDFNPNIGEFLSSENEKIEQHKKNIPESIWRYVQCLGDDYIIKHKNKYRNGFWFVK